MLLVDAMSRHPSRTSEEIKLDMRVNYIAFNKTWTAKLKKATREDPILSKVYQLTQQGWPHQWRQTPRMARAYWDFRDELSTDGRLLLKGPCIVILSCLSGETSPWPLVSDQGPTKYFSTSVLAWSGYRYHWLHKKMPGMYMESTPSQIATTSPRCATATLGKYPDGLLQCEWQVVCTGLWLV